MNKQTNYHKHTLARRVITVVLSFMMVFTMMPLLSPELFQASAAECTGSGSWSGWTTAKPASNAKYESRTEYRYRTRTRNNTTTTSNYSPGTGWVFNYSSRSGDYGSWYSGYKTKPTSYSYREIQSYKVVDSAAYTQYNWYYGMYYNGSDRWFTYSVSYAQNHGGKKYTWSTKTILKQGKSYEGHQSYTSDTKVNFKDEIWWLESTTNVPEKSHTEYRYRDRNWLYYWYKWSNWSGWSDWSTDSITSSDYRDVETRTTYRVWKPAAHKWDAGKITKASGYTHTGTKTYTCTVCGAHKSQTIAKRNAKAVTPAKPKLKSAKGSKGKVTMKWTKVAKNTKGYQIAIRDTSIGKTKYINVGQGKKKTVKSVIKKLTKKHTYLVKVRAYNKIGNETIYGPWSNGKAGKVK